MSASLEWSQFNNGMANDIFDVTLDSVYKYIPENFSFVHQEECSRIFSVVFLFHMALNSLCFLCIFSTLIVN